MTRLRRRALLAFLLSACLLVPSAWAATSEPTALHGDAVVPRTITFSELPRLTTPYQGPILERPESHPPPEIEELLEELKQYPIALSPSTQHQLTIESAQPLGPLAPAVGNGFEGISQGAYIPSEPTVAAGPLNIFSAGNVSVTVTNKDGSNRVETNGKTFFGVPGSEGDVSDAQCYYDALRGRFVALCFTQGTAPNYSNFYLAISKTNDARGQWWLYKFDMSKDGNTQTSNWSDYQAIGISEDKIAFSAQQFTFGGNSYRYQKIRIIDRALAYSGVPVSYVDFANFAAPPGGDVGDLFVTKVARNLTAGESTIHCLCVRTGGGSRVTYRTVTGPPGAPVLSAGNLVSVSAYSAPPDAAQRGSSALVATNDCRPTDFYVRNGVLIASWHTSISLGGTVSAVRLLRLRTSDRVVLTDETFAVSGVFLYYPAVTVDSVGTIFLGFDRSNSSEFPSSYVTGKRRGDASLQASVLVKAGLTATSQSRWGDYTGIDNDASLSGPGQSVAWYAGQWTKATNAFGTWIQKLTYTYGQVAGTVLDDCDGSAGTAGDRTPLAGVTLTLKQGATTVATTLSDASGNYNFGYLETGVYDVLVTPPPAGASVDAIPGSGGNSQTRVSDVDLQIDLTNAQTSVANQFVVATADPLPSISTIVPSTRSAGGAAFTLTVNGSDFATCATVRVDGSDRPTTWVSAAQVTAAIPASDIAVDGVHAITVFNPAPGGGASNSRPLTIGPPDNTPPTITLTAPNGGESWPVGSTQSITWSASDNVNVDHVDLAYSTDGGTTFPNIIATGLANSGSYSWTVPGVLTSTASVRARAFDASDNVGADSSDAVFTISGWTVTASAGANGAIAPSGALAVADGATPSYTMTPDLGYHVADVLVNGLSVGAVTAYTFAPVHSDQTIAVSFAINTYTLTVSVTGNGSVAKNPDQPSYDHGTVVMLTATPDPGWSFDGWTGDATGTTNPLNVTMDGNKSITAIFGQHTYTWNQTGTAAFTTAANWTPARISPSNDDVLVFDNGATTTATGVPSQTIARLLISNNTSAALQAPAASTLTIAGASGTDLSVAAGSTLNLNGTSALTLALGAGATGGIAGTVMVSGAGHRLTATSGSNALAFESGSVLAQGSTFNGNVFGTTALNSVVFQNGSLFVQSGGANPFGATQPNSVVTFQGGSRYRVDAALTPSFSGRTYADFEYNFTSIIAPTGGAPVTIDSLVVSQGTLNVNVTGGANIRGNVRVKSGAALNVNPASATGLRFNGSSPQSIDVFGTFTNAAVDSVVIDNSSGVNLGTNLTLSGPVRFANGRVNTGANVLAVASTGTVLGAAQGTGWVNGNLRRNVASGSSTRLFDVGDAATYAPVTVAMTAAAATFDLTGRTTSLDHPSIGGSTLDAAKSVNRWWSLVPTGSPSFTSWSGTFAFAASDVDLGAAPASFVVGSYAGTWAYPTIGTRTATSTQATGLTTFAEYALAEPIPTDTTLPEVSVIAPNGGQAIAVGTEVTLSWTATDNVAVSFVDLSLSRTGIGGTYDPIATGIPNTGSYQWTATGPATNDAWFGVTAHDTAGNAATDVSDASFMITGTTGVESAIVTSYELGPLSPNPMHGSGRIGFALPAAGRVRLEVLDLQGRQVMMLANREFGSGRHRVDLKPDRGVLPSGLYFIRLEVAGKTMVKRIVISK